MLRAMLIRVMIVTFGLLCIGPFPDVHSQTIIGLPDPGAMIVQSSSFNPLQLKGIQLDPKNALRFEFLVDKGHSGLKGQPLKDEITRLTKYFLTSLTVPEKDLWVNLSPYEKDRIAPESFGVTEMGKGLLEQDYLLKQLVASLSYPENQLGREFWKKVYRKAYELYGTTDIPINTFNKVWIVPQTAQVFVRGNGAFVTSSKLDVMLEADYTSMNRHLDNGAVSKKASSPYAPVYAQVVREVILPQLRQEVNEGKNFAIVRQVFTAMILATWYKRHLKDSLLGQEYVGKNKITGVDVDDKAIKEKIFQQYLKAYKKCVYNYIKEDYDPLTNITVPRKYASGGMDFAMFGIQGDHIYSETFDSKDVSLGSDLAMATIDVSAATGDGKIIDFPDQRLLPPTHPFNQLSHEARTRNTIDSLNRSVLSGLNPLEHPMPFLYSPGNSFIVVDSKPSAANLEEQKDQAQVSDLVYKEEAPASAFKVRRISRWMDISGWLSGMTLAAVSFGFDPVSLAVTGCLLPLITRAAYGFQLWFHEVFGHALPAAVIYPKRAKQAFSVNNLKANFSLSQWMEIVLPWKRPHHEEDPFVMIPSEGRRKEIIRKSGFIATLMLAITGTVTAYLFGLQHSLVLPLIGPMGVSSLAIIKAAWSKDIQSPSKDKFECGNYGVFWIGSAKDGVNPLWIQQGLSSLLSKLIVRGGQSAGQATIIDEQSSDGQANVYLTKVVKSKRGQGSDLVKVILNKFKKGSRGQIKEDSNVVLGINGHVRYATGGPVSKEASHPHMGPQEMRTQWILEDGQFKTQKKNVFVVISHNGDNDAYRLLDREMTLDEIRDFFPKVVHMQKDVFISKTNSAGGYYDYLPLGDSPPIAAQIHFLLTQGSWKASVRYSHVMVNHQTANEAMGDLLSEEQEDAIAEIFEQVFSEHAPSLSRPLLKKGTKSYKDLWVNKEILAKNPGLHNQYEAIARFKEALTDRMLKEMVSGSDAGKVFRSWHQDDIRRKAFVDMTVERFFTGDRWNATQQFRERSNGSYGLVVRTSLQNEGVTIFSKAQGMTLGFNTSKKFFAFASDPLVLQGPFGEKGRLEQLFIMDPRGAGEVADIGLIPSGGLYLRIYSTEKQRELTEDEIENRNYPLNEHNPYYSPPLEYADPNAIIDEDLRNSTAAVFDRMAAFKDIHSPDYQSAEALVEMEVSRYVESFLKDNSLYYSLIKPMTTAAFHDVLNDCLSSSKLCSSTQEEFLQVEAGLTTQNPVISRFIENEADHFLSQHSDRIASELISGKMNDTQLHDLRRQLDEELNVMIQHLLKSTIDKLMNNFSQEQTHWEKIRLLQRETNPSKKTDFFIAGYEKSLWLGENLKQMMLSLMPQMNIEVTSANKNLKDPFQFGIHQRTVALIISLSGTTFPSLALASLLKKMTRGNTFVMTSRMDAMINMALGQRLNPQASFTKRIFLTGNYYPAESAPTSDVLLYAEQILMVIHLVKRLRQIFPHHNPWGLKVNEEDIKQLEAMVQGMTADSKRMTGFDQHHKEVPDEVHQSLVEQGHYLANHILETPRINFLSRLFVFSIFIFGAPIQKSLALAGYDPGPVLASWKGFLAASSDFMLAVWMPYLLTTLVYRTWTHRPRWARTGPPTVVIGDLPASHQIVEAYVSKLGAFAPGSMSINVHGGNPEDHFGARFAHRIVRGIQIICGVPTDRDSQNAVRVTLRQAKGIKNGLLGNWLNGGAEITTIGREEFADKDATDHHINIGGKPVDIQASSPAVKRFYHLSFDAFGRLMAYKVLFNAMYAKASMFTLVPGFTLNLGLFKLKLEPRAFSIWNRAWTYPSISVHTTRSPIGINEEVSAQVEKIVAAQPVGQSSSSDKAMVSRPDTKGGIDMDSRKMEFNITGEEPNMAPGEVNLPWNSIEGLVPRVSGIVSVTPMMLQTLLTSST